MSSQNAHIGGDFLTVKARVEYRWLSMCVCDILSFFETMGSTDILLPFTVRF